MFQSKGGVYAALSRWGVKSTETLEAMMRVPLEAYLRGPGAKVYSLVVGVPFSPLDIDLGHLARGEWNALTDRFRVWHLPSEDAKGPPVCYVMVRKFYPKDDVIVYGHMLVNTYHKAREENGRSFTVGIMSNDEVRARVMLNSILDIPPSFHRRGDLRLIEKKWRGDPNAVMRFLANVQSVIARSIPNPSGKMYTLKFEPPPGLMEELTHNLSAWWQ